MKHTNLPQQIKDLRTGMGLSQEQLADQSGLSLRTVQRIENGETEPRGDSLTRLARALHTSHTELISRPEREDRSYLAVFNLSALGFIVFPLFGVLVPLVLWLSRRDTIKDLDHTGRKLINFQITWCLLVGVYYLFMIGSFLGNLYGDRGLEVFFGLSAFVYVLYAVNGIFIIVNSIRSSRAKSVIYRPAIPFLR